MPKILIVDDEQFIRELVRKYANFEGYDTEEAENGFLAVKMVKDDHYDLIIRFCFINKIFSLSICLYRNQNLLVQG